MKWYERREELIREGKHRPMKMNMTNGEWSLVINNSNPLRDIYPRFITLISAVNVPHINSAVLKTHAPVRVSEELIDDQPDFVALFLNEPANLGDFWDAYDESKRKAESKGEPPMI